ncbi:MAG: deoxyguanosinetriphosphate triphosphohydrolase [Armatimonadota bacterium]|nr:deoxyguanosinetriphosphate triphosphohydrolase [Armatimonadota bacterium]MDR7443029.1 deoxyguanosinetriphosphate triphosphohydrolase [Armatimonadota bacterium]MDR7569367.1 deoxyguanosinetriphosphate triphosphohydrolase [Armatimonadota bacterium]MDR7614516.1 deoxyguanosinetriphosphate triphosphohydrolase [Armatimonadota bacterium]
MESVGRIRERVEAEEAERLSPYATLSRNSRGRRVPEPEDDLRTCFQRDRDRVIHSKAFRRLKHKTQVFLAPEGDHYRTRLTHTLEVAQIARTIARALRLNEDLTEAIVLAHDLGHPPFGHAGEAALDEVMRPWGGFRHPEQSLRVVDLLEQRRRSDGTVEWGLNLTWEVRDGILGHSKGTADMQFEHGLPATLEGQVARVADRIAYVHHDMDDAVRAGLLREEEIPREVREVLGPTRGRWVDVLVRDVVASSEDRPRIAMSEPVRQALDLLKDFLFERVYLNPAAKAEEPRAQRLLRMLFEHFLDHPERISPEYQRLIALGEPVPRVVCDFLAGMTDRYAIRIAESLFLPRSWVG